MASGLVIPLLSWLFKVDDDLSAREELQKADAWHLVRGCIRILPVISLALMVTYWQLRLVDDEPSPQQILGAWLIHGLVFCVALAIFLPVVSRLYQRFGRVKIGNLVSIVAFAGLWLPLWIHDTRAEGARGKREAMVQTLHELSISLGRHWIDDIRAAAAHGPAGEIPPMLAVDLRGEEIEVTNLARRDLCLRLAQVSVVQGGLFRCPVIGFESSPGCTNLGAESSRTFQIGRVGCREGKLEFRIGDFEHGEVGWWSDSALLDLENGLTQSRLNGPLLHFYRDDSDYELQQEISQQTELLAEARDRATRWRQDANSWKRTGVN